MIHELLCITIGNIVNHAPSDSESSGKPAIIVLGDTATTVLGDLAQVKEVHLNVAQNVIVITEDRLRIHLSNNEQRMEKRGQWVAPLGILISVVLTIATANFKDYVLKASTWEALFIIGAIGSFVWLCYAYWQRLEAETIDQVIERIKSEPK